MSLPRFFFYVELHMRVVMLRLRLCGGVGRSAAPRMRPRRRARHMIARLQRSEERHQVTVLFPRGALPPCTGWCAHAKSLCRHLEIDLGVAVRGLERHVTDPADF